MIRNLFLLAVLVLLFVQSAFAQTEELPDTVWTKFTYPNAVNAVKFTPDGRYLASGGDDGIPKLWDAETGDLVREFLGNGSKIWSLDINNTGELIAVVNDSSVITIWNVLTGEIVKKIRYYKFDNNSNGRCVAFSNNGKYMAAILSRWGEISTEFDLVLFDVESWEVESEIKTIRVPMHIAFSSDDTKIAVSNFVVEKGKITVAIFEIPSLKTIRILNDFNDGGIRQSAFSPDGKYLAGALESSPNKIWNTSDWKLFKEFGGNGYSVAFSPDSKYVVTGEGTWGNRHIFIRNAQTGDLIYTYPRSNVPNSIDVSPDNRFIAASLMTSGIIVYNAKWNPTSVQDNPVQIIEPIVFPNPTNSTANIRFDLLNSASINIQIYDINSRLIAHIFDGYLDAGNHNFEWNTAQTPSGSYFARITTNGIISSIQIIVNK